MSDNVLDLSEFKEISAEKLLKFPQAEAEKIFNSFSPDKRTALVISAPFRDRMDLILMAEDPKGLVQSLPEDEVYWTIKERGALDSLAIISRTTHQQFQYLIDVDGWNRDKIDFNNIAEWYTLLGKCNESKVVEWFENADERFLVSTLKRFMGVLKLEEESDILEEYEDMPNNTFDNVYYFQFADDETRLVLMPILGVLYRYDSSFFYSLVNAVLYEFTAESDEDAFRWRQVRMAEKGFPEIDEALGIYQFISDREIEKLQGRFIEKTADGSESSSGVRYLLALDAAPAFFASAVRHISDIPTLEDVQKNIIHLANKIIMADCLEVRNIEDRKMAVEKAEAYINIGIELLSGEDILKATDVLTSVHPAELFRIGYSCGLKLKNRLNEYVRENGDTILSFADLRISEAVSGLFQIRPQYFEGLGERGEITFRDFKSIVEVRKTEESVLDLIFSYRLMFEFFGLVPEHYMSEADASDPGKSQHPVTCTSLMNTILVNNMCHGRACPDPLGHEDVLKFFDTVLDYNEKNDPCVKSSVKEEAFNWIKDSFELEKPELGSLERFLDESLDLLSEELKSVYANEAIDSRYITTLLLKQGQEK